MQIPSILKSVYSRIFYRCTVVLMFACAMAGLILTLTANQLHEAEASENFARTSRVVLSRIRSICAEVGTASGLPVDELRTELESYAVLSYVDCYLFDRDGVCLVRSDYNKAELTLSSVLRGQAAREPYCELSGAVGGFTEATATYVERTEIDGVSYYLMLLFPVGYLSSFSGRLFLVLVVAVLVIALLGALIFYFTTAQLLRPILNLTRITENYAAGDFSQRIHLAGDSEFDHLAETMNRMADFIDRSERSRQRFISDISHELKTPLTTIGGFVENIADGTIPAEKHAYYLDIVASEVRRMTRMVQSMLNISRFEEGTQEPVFVRCDLTHLLIETLLLFEKKIDDKDVRVEGLDACPRTPAEVDRDLIQQVFFNLAENAIKFVDPGGVITLAVATEGTQAQVHIRNSGEGLSEDEMPRVFDRFYKTDLSRGRDRTGVGLGLSIVSRIVTLHGGTVTVKSVKGEYTEFIVSLPLMQMRTGRTDDPDRKEP